MRSRTSAIAVSILIVFGAVTSTCGVTGATVGERAFESYAAVFTPELITAAFERRLVTLLTTENVADVLPPLAEKTNVSGARVAARLVGARGVLAATLAGEIGDLAATVEAQLRAARSNGFTGATIASTRDEIRKAVRETLSKSLGAPGAAGLPTIFETRVATWVTTVFPIRDNDTLQSARVSRENMAVAVQALVSVETLASAVAELFVPSAPQTAAGMISLVGKDLAARRTWAAVALLFCICWIALMTIAMWRTVEELGGVAGIATILGSAALGILAVVVWWMFRERFSWTPLLAEDVLAVFVEQRKLGIVNVAVAFNVLAMIAVSVVLVASWSTFWRDSVDLAMIERQRNSLRLIFNAAAAVMVAGVLEVSVLYAWPSTLLDADSGKAIGALANSIAALTAVLFSAILCATYFPAASVLARRREALVLAPVDDAATSAGMETLQHAGGLKALSANPQQAVQTALAAGGRAAAFTATVGSPGGLQLVDPASQTFARLFQALGPIIAGLPLAALVEFLTIG